MKKVALVAVAVAMAAGLAVVASAGSQNDAGCGVGSLIFKNNDAGSQILAATTNGTFGNQTFGITTGSVGCTGGGIGKMTGKAKTDQVNFVAANFRDLNREMVTGGGEYVNSLAALMGCTKEAAPAFASFTQSHYKTIGPSEKTAPEAIVESLHMGIAQDAVLASACTL